MPHTKHLWRVVRFTEDLNLGGVRWLRGSNTSKFNLINLNYLMICLGFLLGRWYLQVMIVLVLPLNPFKLFFLSYCSGYKGNGKQK